VNSIIVILIKESGRLLLPYSGYSYIEGLGKIEDWIFQPTRGCWKSRELPGRV